jgi:hypothetical protein
LPVATAAADEANTPRYGGEPVTAPLRHPSPALACSQSRAWCRRMAPQWCPVAGVRGSVSVFWSRAHGSASSLTRGGGSFFQCAGGGDSGE